MVETNINRAERDNDLIYHQDVPNASSLPAIQPAVIAKAIIPNELTNPSLLVPGNEMLFSGLMGWDTREAISKRCKSHWTL